MRKIFQLLIILVFPLSVFGQDGYLARLSISGGVSELGISPSEEVWVATKAGNVYYTKQVGELWHIGPFGSLDEYNISTGNTFERINFFSENTMMISGFIQEGGKEDFVYWSGDHGKTWGKIIFGKSSWLDAAYIDDNGKAWMSGSSQLIYYTTDSGKTWTSFTKVEPTGNLRFASIFFSKDEKTGLFGSVWNKLYKTTDNCKSWKRLPTPLDQKKYQRLTKEEHPEIEKIRIFGNYYVIKQQARTFITKSDTIKWTYLPNVFDFEVTESGDLYTVDNDLSIKRYNGDFIKTWQADQKLKDHPRAIGVKNNKLFALTSEYLYKISPDKFDCSQLFTNDIGIPEPYLKLSFEGKKFGFENRDILCFDEANQKWYRFMTLDFAIANAAIFEKKLIIADESLSKYYKVDADAKSITEFKLPVNLLAEEKVKEVYFEQGFQGCFSSDNQHRSYIKRSNKFVVDKASSSLQYLSGSMKSIDQDTIKKIIGLVNKSRFLKISLAELNITAEDINSFKLFIDKEKKRFKATDFDPFEETLYNFPGQYADLDFYKSSADSLGNLSEATINNAFWQAYGNWSTTTTWRRVIFIFEDGKKLIVGNSDDKPNYFYTPWIVDYEGLKFKINSIRFGQYIDQITNTQFFDKDVRDKNYAIFKITDYLYRKKLQGE